MILVKQEKLAASLCDSSVKLSPLGAFEIVEDLVTEMMGALSIDGVTCMREYGAMWVFVRNRIELRSDLHWMDEYVAECAISSTSAAKMAVDTVLRRGGEGEIGGESEGEGNGKGEIALASRLELCAVDLETGRIRRSESVGIGEKTLPEDLGVDIAYARERFGDGEPIETLTVRSADIDYCHHTNNISYIRYLMNRFSVEQLEQKPIRAIEAHYLNQSFESEDLTIYDCGDDRFSIRRGDEPIVNCALSFEL